MPIITLTTDIGLKDHYVAAIKGAILSHIDQIQIIDITHEVQSFSILQATFVLQNCFKDFAEVKELNFRCKLMKLRPLKSMARNPGSKGCVAGKARCR